jgi:hypothetical protein
MSKPDSPSHPGKQVPDEDTERPIARVVESFIWEIEALADSLPLVMPLLETSQKVEGEKFNKFLHQRCVAIHGGKRFTVPPEVHPEFVNVRRKFEQSRKALQIIPRSFLTSLVSHYDAFLGSLIRALFSLKQELLNSSDRSLSFKELTCFDSIESAREFIIEKEVETLLRNSHSEQFKWMENKFGLTLTKDLPSWAPFIEVMERRNLFVHCNGIVSTQYLSVCSEHKVDCSKVKIGDELQVDQKYFRVAYATVLEIGVKLAHVLWRSQKPDEMQFADESLNNVCLNLIRDEKYDVAQNLLDFGSAYKKFGSETVRRTIILNRAQAYKWGAQNEKATEILAAEDWTASNEKFRLANAVLSDHWDEAAGIMRSLGVGGPPTKGDYKEWPIFKQFRTTKQFAAAYKDIFAEPFVEVAAEGNPDKN